MADTPVIHPQRLHVTLRPVASTVDVPALADINERALEGDPMKQWMRLYTERTEWDTAVRDVTEALTDPKYTLIKAIIPDPENAAGEKIVGFVYWMCGYIQLEQVDPFAATPQSEQHVKPVVDAKDVMSNMAEELSSQATELERMPTQTREGLERIERLKRGEAKFVESRNHYIGAIRGKKHMYIRRLMVLPEYQRRGVAGKLLGVVTDEADRLKIVSWLFARPAGEKLYDRFGFKVLAETEMDEGALKCPPVKAMMRLPKL